MPCLASASRSSPGSRCRTGRPRVPAPAAPGRAGAPEVGVILRDRRYLLVLGAMLLITLLEAQVHTILPLMITMEDYPVGLYATVIALNAVMVILLELPLTPLIQRLPINLAISIGAVLTGLGF